MTHSLTTNYAKNYCNRTLIVKVIVENVVTCFFGTQCRLGVNGTVLTGESGCHCISIVAYFYFLYNCISLAWMDSVCPFLSKRMCYLTYISYNDE